MNPTIVRLEHVPQVRALLVSAVELLLTIEDADEDSVPPDVTHRAQRFRALLTERATLVRKERHDG